MSPIVRPGSWASDLKRPPGNDSTYRTRKPRGPVSYALGNVRQLDAAWGYFFPQGEAAKAASASKAASAVGAV